MAKLFRALLSLIVAVTFLMTGDARPLFAQETKSPSILEFFGFRSSKPKVVQKRQTQKASFSKKAKLKKPTVGRKKAQSNRRPSTPRAPAAQTVPEDTILTGLPAVPDKLLDAKTILVVGDFMADGVSEGIEQAFENDAGVRVVSKANGSSGFIRDDFYNWTQEITAVSLEIKPSVIVVMIGTNDRQPLKLNGAKAVVRSAEWTAEYERRVAGFADAAKATGAPLVWIGMPPFKQPTMSSDMLVFNDIYRRNAERVSGAFVDIWDGFLDEQGAFSINGSDYIGQPVRLRASDGTNLTFPGKRKVAFFAEKPIRVALGSIGSATPSAFNPFNLPGPKPLIVEKPADITRLPPVSLFDPTFDGDSELLGSTASGPKDEPRKTIAKTLYVDGIAPNPVLGRVDDVNVAQQKTTAPLDAAEVKTP